MLSAFYFSSTYFVVWIKLCIIHFFIYSSSTWAREGECGKVGNEICLSSSTNEAINNLCWTSGGGRMDGRELFGVRKWIKAKETWREWSMRLNFSVNEDIAHGWKEEIKFFSAEYNTHRLRQSWLAQWSSVRVLPDWKLEPTPDIAWKSRGSSLHGSVLCVRK